MAFPTAITNEPPPCMSSEDEDSEEFHSHGLKLDVPSGEPTPVSTPLKKAKPAPNSNARDEGAPTNVNNNSKTIVNNSDKDLVLEVISDPEEFSVLEATIGSHLQTEDDSAELPQVNGTASPEPVNNDDGFSINGENEKVVTVTNYHEPNAAASSINDNKDSVGQDSEDGPVATTSASEELETANEICDKSANNNDSEINQTSGHCEYVDVDPSSPSGESGERVNAVDVGRIINDMQQIEQNKLSENDESIQVPSPHSSQPLETLEDNNTEGPSEIQEDLTTSRVTSDPEFLEFPAVTSNPGDAKVSSSPSTNNQPVTTGPPVDQADFDDDDEFGDFGAFQSIPNTSAVNKQEQGIMDTTGTLSVPQSVGFDDDDDDFGDFAQVPVQQTSQEVSVHTPQASAQTRDDSEDFADFQDCSFSSFPSFGVPTLNKRHSSTSSDSSISLISSKADSIVKSLFVADSSLPDTDDNDVKLKTIDSEISISNDEVWARVQDFEGSQGLAFKLGNSLTEKRLLRSLNIDNSNIMYHEKWGTIEVPKFAASLVMASPLQPQSCNQNLADSQIKPDSPNVSVNNNNLKEGISCQEQDKPPSISAEAQEILRHLPDLSYMRANTLVFPQTSPSGI